MKENKGSTIGLSTIVFLIFLVLKLAGIGQVATWSWIWVTSPIWISAILALVITSIILIWEIIK